VSFIGRLYAVNFDSFIDHAEDYSVCSSTETGQRVQFSLPRCELRLGKTGPNHSYMCRAVVYTAKILLSGLASQMEGSTIPVRRSACCLIQDHADNVGACSLSGLQDIANVSRKGSR